MIQFEKRKYRLVGITPLVGSQPASQEIREQFIATKAPVRELGDEEMGLSVFERDEKGVTVFMRDAHDGLCMMDYQIRGFFKGALTALKAQTGVAAVRSKVDTLLFVGPRFIPILRDGVALREEDEMLERPLRANTPQGERQALQSSEMVYDPWTIEIEIALVPNRGTPKSRPLDWEAVEAALGYGAYHGLGQWRSGGYGSFRWEEIAHVD